MFIDKDHFDGWMRRIMERFDKLEKMQSPAIVQSRTLLPDGDMLLDNFDLCQMLNVSKRTLQQKCIRLNYRKLIDSKQGVGNDLETTETHYSALIFIDSNSSFTNKDI